MNRDATLNPLKLGLTLGIMGAVSMFIINYYPSLTNWLSFMNQHGNSLRFMMEDIYPIYNHTALWRELVGIVFAFIDCFVFGFFTGYLYNWLLKK